MIAIGSFQARYCLGYGIKGSDRLIPFVKSLIEGPNKFLCLSLIIRLVMPTRTRHEIQRERWEPIDEWGYTTRDAYGRF